MKRGWLNIEWRHAPEVIWRSLVFLIAGVILLVAVTRWNRWQGAPGWKTTDDAYLASDLTPIAAKVAGYIRDEPVQDYDRVKAGQLVAEVVDDDYRAAVAQAEANVSVALAQAKVLASQQALQAANVTAAQAVANATGASLAQNARDIARQKVLLASGSSSPEATEKLETVRAQLTDQLAQNRAQALAAQRQIGVLAAQEGQADAQADAARAALRAAQINLGYTRILAPTDGVLGQRQIRPGQYVGVGGQVITETPLPRVWVIANFKETQLTHLAVGERAEIRVDTFPGQVLRGHVQAYAPGSGAQFALLPPDNATGNFTKVVQRIAVKIVIDDADGLADRLRPGMSVIAKIDARDDHR